MEHKVGLPLTQPSKVQAEGWQAGSEKHVALYLRVLSSCPALGVSLL